MSCFMTFTVISESLLYCSNSVCRKSATNSSLSSMYAFWSMTLPNDVSIAVTRAFVFSFALVALPWSVSMMAINATMITNKETPFMALDIFTPPAFSQ